MKTTKAVKKTVVKKEEPSKLFRKLSSVFLVSTAEFAKATPTAQTKLMADAGGLPVEFVADFNDLRNRRLIRDKLLAGKDVSRELEFNGVLLSLEELGALRAVKPVLAKIDTIGPKYQWLKAEDYSQSFTFVKDGSSERIIRSNGNYITKGTALSIWKKASKFWFEGGQRPPSNVVRGNGSYYADNRCTYSDTGVKIGCQSVTRSEAEFIARHYGWEPVTE